MKQLPKGWVKSRENEYRQKRDKLVKRRELMANKMADIELKIRILNEKIRLGL